MNARDLAYIMAMVLQFQTQVALSLDDYNILTIYIRMQGVTPRRQG